MASLLLVGNPAKRRRKASTRRPSAAQLRARAKFAAMARARAAKARSGRKSASSTTTRTNPVKRRRHVTARKAHHARRRTRRNPANLNLRGITAQLKIAALGAAGALASDVAFGFAAPYLPAMVSSPISATGGINYAYYAAKGAMNIGLGLLLNKVSRSNAAQMTHGALTVTMSDAFRQFARANVPSLALGAYVSGGSPRMAPLARMPGGKVLPMLPAARSLRGVNAYVSAASREAFVR